ncbi:MULTISPECIES: hypothetical protein [unclassified Burkholderia]|uniref:hypothetical protein n=1 Tax=unclassified Burkholderia TaxID=2613784 RepID=UPI0016399F77|nr:MULTISPECIES: hypothetical protein [unclassified Burkholderia]
MTKVTFPLTGHSYSDDGSSDHDMLNGGQALRDITTQPGWPTSISWPDPPTIGQPRKT